MESNETSKLLEKISTLKEINTELETIIESIYDEVYVTDADGTTLRVNSACKRFLGLEPNKLIGKNVNALKFINPVLTPKVVKEKRVISIIQITKTGREAIVTATPVFDNEGNVSKVVCITRDITEMNKLKKELEKTEKMMINYKEQLLDMQTHNNDIIDNIVCKSKKMKNVIELARKVSKYDSNILITGESGVGKGVVASYIHNMSHWKATPFISVNCGSIPENLLESEFFGYEKGAFTGASKEGKIGLFELSNNGTLFLDEICELPLPLQVKLLSVIQEKTFVKVGGSKQIKVNFRLIAAGNKPLKPLVKKGLFREDLYYRLNVLPIEIPPLKERKEDILPLIYNYLNQLGNHYNKKLSISSEAIDCLMGYPWPGNVRELENMVERLIVTVDESEIKLSHIPSHIKNNSLYPIINEIEEISSLKDSVDEFEKEIILKAYKKLKSTYKVAELLKVSQSAIARRLKKYKLEMKNIDEENLIR